jgi:peptidyl-prolyl cis-trans isomerase SurA
MTETAAPGAASEDWPMKWIAAIAVATLALGALAARAQPAETSPAATPTDARERTDEPAARPTDAARRRIIPVDRIVAVVNNEVITQYELQLRLRDSLRELERRGTSMPASAELERQVLERLITERVQLQLARDSAIRVDDADLDRTVARIAEANKMTVVQFRDAFERDGVPFTRFREDLRNEVVVQRLREREVDNKITVAESEIENYMADQKEGRDGPSELLLSHILIRVPDQANPEQLQRQRARADEVVRRLKEGADFAQLAAAYSDAPDGTKGGDMGWRSRDHLPDLYVDASANLRPGEVSEVLRSPAGFHVLKMVDRRSADAPLMVEQNRVRHILVRTNEVVSEDEARRKLEGLRERIVNGADFGDLARQYSDDGTSSRGGDLGWVYPGDTVPDFERAMIALEPGQLSQPVRSPFGWHLIQVMERRTADVSNDRKRLEARRALRERKSDEAYQEWLRQLRDRSYVEYRLDDR